MDIYSKSGTVVIYTGKGGMDNDKTTANQYLTVGNKYTVDYTNVGSWSTEVYLKEITATWPSGHRVYFNSVMFKHEDEVESTAEYIDRVKPTLSDFLLHEKAQKKQLWTMPDWMVKYCNMIAKDSTKETIEATYNSDTGSEYLRGKVDLLQSLHDKRLV